ncbi:MAG: cation transporter [Leptospiraceae bacterium]|nr:cation transporter [Leptospiraceae bacterium]MCP5495070.1 cation transporter [Leptospiraceae bacterium]
MNDNHIGHDHNHGDLKGRKLWISILLNVLVTIAQVIGGIFSGSLSLLSDALHNFSDVISLLISYIAAKLSHKKYDSQKTFGYKRAEIIAAMINSATLLVIAVLFIFEVGSRFNKPITINSLWIITLAIFSIFVNATSALLIRGDASKNMNMKSAYLHLMSDMMTSVAVLLGGVVMYYWEIYWIDSILSVAISIYLIYSSWGLLMQTLRVLMQFPPTNFDLDAIVKELSGIPEIKNLHHVHVWQLNDTDIHFEAHVDMMQDLPLSVINVTIDQIHKILKDKFNINHTTLQPEISVKDSKQLVVND